MKIIFAVIGLAALVGCVSTDAAEETRFYSFKGLTMSQFMADTMATPSDSYDTDGKRVFIVNKGACTIHVETVKNGRGSGPDGWTVVRTRRQGGCTTV